MVEAALLCLQGVFRVSPCQRPAVAERRLARRRGAERDKVGSRGGRREATRADAGGREAIAMKYLRKKIQRPGTATITR